MIAGWITGNCYICFVIFFYIMFVLQDEPFTSHSSDGLFNIARYLLHCMMGEVPIGISKVYPFVAAANQLSVVFINLCRCYIVCEK